MPARRTYPRRWFIYSSAGLFVFLCLSIIYAALLLMQHGTTLQRAIVGGSSMEPALRGPRLLWTCPHCDQSTSFAFETIKSGQPPRCPNCNELDRPFNLEESMIEKDRYQLGQEVIVAPLRLVRMMRSKEAKNAESLPSGPNRWDIVLINAPDGNIREIKRLVGLPHEQVQIRQGDLHIDGQRAQKSLSQALRQSILVANWEPSEASQTADPIQTWKWQDEKRPFDGWLSQRSTDIEPSKSPDRLKLNLPYPISNALSINSHDSHLLIPVPDIGVALKIASLQEEWSIDLELQTPSGQQFVSINYVPSKWTVAAGPSTCQWNQPPDESWQWLIVACIDGRLVVGSPLEERFSQPIDSIAPDPSTEDTNSNDEISSICILPRSGRCRVTQTLVFRDTYYRGPNDSEEQTWESGNGVVVLGDNVSISSDSRTRWPDGLSPNAIKGVILQNDNPIESLLRQR